MTDTEILEGLKEVLHVLKPKTDLSAVCAETRLVTDLGVDSLSQMLLAIAVEDKFNVSFENAVSFQTVGDVIEFVKAKLA